MNRFRRSFSRHATQAPFHFQVSLMPRFSIAAIAAADDAASRHARCFPPPHFCRFRTFLRRRRRRQFARRRRTPPPSRHQITPAFAAI